VNSCVKVEDGLRRLSSIDVDASPSHTRTLTFDLQNLIRSSVGANKYIPVRFIKTAQAVHGIGYRSNNI